MPAEALRIRRLPPYLSRALHGRVQHERVNAEQALEVNAAGLAQECDADQHRPKTAAYRYRTRRVSTSFHADLPWRLKGAAGLRPEFGQKWVSRPVCTTTARTSHGGSHLACAMSGRPDVAIPCTAPASRQQRGTIGRRDMRTRTDHVIHFHEHVPVVASSRYVAPAWTWRLWHVRLVEAHVQQPRH
eukprot:scaffold131137_cov31-Tisochrysis_lutea.AAC.2